MGVGLHWGCCKLPDTPHLPVHRAGFLKYGRDCAQADIQNSMTYYICQRLMSRRWRNVHFELSGSTVEVTDNPGSPWEHALVVEAATIKPCRVPSHPLLGPDHLF